MSVSEEELRQAHGVPADVHADVRKLAGQVDELQLQLARALELLEVLLGIATGEVTVFRGTVEIVDPAELATRWPPAEPAP